MRILEKPILFNTDMVKAILEGRKTTTRRIIKNVGNRELLEHEGEYYKFGYRSNAVAGTIYSAINWCKPKFEIGDILYVRETWLAHSRGVNTLAFKYKADSEVNDCISFTKERFNKFYKFADQEKWQPSLFMPKEAARIFLKIKKIYPERLKMIEAGECKNEGIKLDFEITDSFTASEYISAFEDLWNSTLNKSQVKYMWHENPWVWVIEFERVEK
ncbi:hypothetical protein [Clostridium beijerinckii]|uniref:hypothetical protein n=1 Tax=Clostridium beijerinckii TaxID=1520 RepID=UPI001FA864B2|nr:hypothetical protein [Clostridium beijerinckii]